MRKIISGIIAIIILVSTLSSCSDNKPQTIEGGKSNSTFYPTSYMQAIQENKSIESVSTTLEAQIVSADYYMQMSYDELWEMIIAPNIPRAHMVWSNGFCPTCKKAVAMYSWITDPIGNPWKVTCPFCKDNFPKNDFKKYYESGLDDKGYFKYDNADKSLLFNTEHPDKDDPLHMFGVDDGYGYIDDKGNTYWFSAYYFIKGQWYKYIMPAITGLASAYINTGNIEYARRCGIILDRLADFFPEYDFKTQGIMYEGTTSTAGAFSYVINNAGDIKSITLAYDKVFDALKTDKELVKFLKTKAVKTGKTKGKFSDIQKNIEQGIFQTTLDRPEDIASNYPLQPYCQFLIYSVLGKDKYTSQINKLAEEIIQKSTNTDGTTGEKGLPNYTLMDYSNFSDFMGMYISADSTYLDKAIEKNPKILMGHKLYSDTFMGGGYYPNNCDGGGTTITPTNYAKRICTNSNIVNLYWNLYKKTKDVSYAQAIYQASPKNSVAYFDSGTTNLNGIKEEIDKIINENGSEIKPNSTDFTGYKMAALHSNTKNNHGFIFDYDSGGGHGHDDAMTIEFWAYGANLMLDLGYPAVNYGSGWISPEVGWYYNSASHNTVNIANGLNIVRGSGYTSGNGKTNLFAPAVTLKGFGAVGTANNTSVYNRHVFMTNIDDEDAYLFDIFHVNSTAKATKNLSANLSTLTTNANLTVTEPLNTSWFVKDTKKSSISSGFTANFKMEQAIFTKLSNVNAKYIELSNNVDVYTYDKWFNLGDYNIKNPAYMPGIATIFKQSQDKNYKGAFVSIYEPYTNASKIKSSTRLAVTNTEGKNTGESDVAAEVKLINSKTDVYLFVDKDDALSTKSGNADKAIGILKSYNIELNGQFAFARFDQNGILERIVVTNAKSFKTNKVNILFNDVCAYAEIEFADGVAKVISGNKDDLKIATLS